MAAKHSYGSYAPELAADFIAGFEGLSLSAYACPAGKLTIGYGHTTGVVEGQTCTPEEASQWLIEDIAKTQKELAPFVNVRVTEGQFIALTSLAFNVGPAYVTRKCPKLMRALNACEFEEAAKQFLDIVKANGVVLPGLVKRRRAESALFLDEY